MRINMSDVKIIGTLKSGDEIIINMPTAQFLSSTNIKDYGISDNVCCLNRQDYITDARVIATYNDNSLNQSLATVSFKTKKSPYLNEENVIVPLCNKERKSPYFKEENTKDQNNSTTKIINKKEKNAMKNNFNFGRIDTDKIAYSIKGIAFKNSNGDYLVYNSDGTATNVSNFVYEIPIFAMPVAKKDLIIGDVIKHEIPDTPNNFVIIKEIKKNAIVAINPFRNEEITIIPQTSIFGFSYYTKIITFNLLSNKDASESSPFGNILPFLLMSNNKNDSDNDNLMLMLLMNNENTDIQKYLPFFFMNK